jgi:hypothetical protein
VRGPTRALPPGHGARGRRGARVVAVAGAGSKDEWRTGRGPSTRERERNAAGGQGREGARSAGRRPPGFAAGRLPTGGG